MNSVVCINCNRKSYNNPGRVGYSPVDVTDNKKANQLAEAVTSAKRDTRRQQSHLDTIFEVKEQLCVKTLRAPCQELQKTNHVSRTISVFQNRLASRKDAKTDIAS